MAELRDTLLLDIDQALRQILELENALNRALSQIVVDVNTSAAQVEVEQLNDELSEGEQFVKNAQAAMGDFTGDLKAAERAADKLEDEIDEVKETVSDAADESKRFSKTVDRDASKAVDKLRGQVKKLGGVILAAFAVREIARFAASTVNAATDLEESANAVNVVFLEATATIEAFGQTSATSVGLAQSEFNALATNTGALLTNFGFDVQEAADSTIILTQRASDLASVFNTEVGEALDAINAALRGETEPIRRFGISLSAAEVAARAVALGLADSTAAVDTTAKATAALNLILEQSDKVAGDFANTSGGLANQQRILKAQLEDVKAELGQALIPALLAVTEVAPTVLDALLDLGAGFAAIAEFFQDLPSAVQTAVIAIAGLGVAFTLLALNPIIAALVAVGAAIIAIGAGARDQQSDIDALTASLLTFGEVTPEAIALSIGKDPEKDIARLAALGKSVEDVVAALADGTIKSGEFGRELRRLNRQAPDDDFFVQPSKLFDTIDALEALEGAVESATTTADATRNLAVLGDAGQDLSFRIDGTTDAWTRYTLEQTAAKDEAALLEERLDSVSSVVEEAGFAADTANEAFRNTAFEMEAVTEATQTAAGALESSIASLDGVAGSLVGVVDGLEGAVDPITQAGEDIVLTADLFVENLDAQVRQLEEFEGRLVLLASQGFTNLAESLRQKGPELSQIAGEFLADPLQAQVAEDLLSGKGTEVGDEYAAQIAEALAQFDFDDPATIAVLSFAESLTTPGNVAIIRSSFEALLSSAFAGVSAPTFTLPSFNRALDRGPGDPGFQSPTGGDTIVNFVNSSFDSDPLGEAAQAANIISTFTGLTSRVPR